MPTSTDQLFSPRSKAELETAVDGYPGGYLKLSQTGDCSDGKHGPIGEWDVSRIADMNGLFYNKRSFNGDISKWAVSSVTAMIGMFRNVKSFNRDISKWDVSSVTHMDNMFQDAQSFKQQLCGAG